MELKSNFPSKNVSDSSRLICGFEESSDTVHTSNKFEDIPASQSSRNSNFDGNINRTMTESQAKNKCVDATFFQAQFLYQDVYPNENTGNKDIGPTTKSVSHLSAFIRDEFIYYEYPESFGNEENNDWDEILVTSQEDDEVNKYQCIMTDEDLSQTNVSLLNDISKKKPLPTPKKDLKIVKTLQSSFKTENAGDTESFKLASFKATSVDSLKTAEGNDTNLNKPRTLKSKKFRLAFKRITPVEVVEEYLKNSENSPYEELYHRAAEVASLMTELQEEATKIDKEINDFEVARKSNQQIAIEEARLEREQVQREDDAIFEELLKNYGNFTKSNLGEWTMFYENFYKKHLDENPEHCRLLLFLRNHQYIQDFYKRKNAREKAKQKINTAKFTNIIDSPPSRLEQKSMEESDRIKRKPAIDPLVFEDRKMADVYGLVYKIGDAFIGNQLLRNRTLQLKDLNTAKNLCDNSRPKRARGRRAENDTDHSDHTPVGSDAEESTVLKRIRNTRVNDDSITFSRKSVKTKSSSRESSPGLGPKTFASGKRVGRPLGSKTQVKLPSKLKSVQAAGEITETNVGEPIESLNNIEECNVSEPPMIIINECDQISKPDIGRNFNYGVKQCKDDKKNKISVQRELKATKNTLNRGGRSRRSKTSVIVKHPEKIIAEPESKLEVVKDENSSDSKLDQDILVPTELGKNANSLSTSPSTSLSSVNTASSLGRHFQIYSTDIALDSHIKKDNEIKSMGERIKNGTLNESTSKDIQSNSSPKKREGVTTVSLASTKITKLPYEDVVFIPPEQSPPCLMMKVTRKITSLHIDKPELSSVVDIYPSIVQYKVSDKESASPSSKKLRNSVISKVDDLLIKNCTADDKDSHKVNESHHSFNHKRQKLSTSKYQASSFSKSQDKIDLIQNPHENISSSSRTNQVVTNNLFTSSLAPMSYFENFRDRAFPMAYKSPRSKKNQTVLQEGNQFIEVPSQEISHPNKDQVEDLLVNRRKLVSNIYGILHTVSNTENSNENSDLEIQIPHISSAKEVEGATVARSSKPSYAYNLYTTTVEDPPAPTSSFSINSILQFPTPHLTNTAHAPLIPQQVTTRPRRGCRPKLPSKKVKDFNIANKSPHSREARNQSRSEYNNSRDNASQVYTSSLGKRQRKLHIDLSHYNNE